MFPCSSFPIATRLHITLDSGPFTSIAGVTTSGLTGAYTYTFATSGGVQPGYTLYPPDNDDYAPEYLTTLQINFTIPIYLSEHSYYNITFENDSDQQIYIIPIYSNNVTINNNTVYITIPPTIRQKEYHVQIPSAAFTSYLGVIEWVGTLPQDWNFYAVEVGHCSPCPNGMYGNGDNCQFCPTGTYSVESTTMYTIASCQACPVGTYASTPGRSGLELLLFFFILYCCVLFQIMLFCY